MRISDERYKDLLSRCIHYIQHQLDNEKGMTKLEEYDLAYCITRDIHEGNVSALETLGVVFKSKDI